MVVVVVEGEGAVEKGAVEMAVVGMAVVATGEAGMVLVKAAVLVEIWVAGRALARLVARVVDEAVEVKGVVEKEAEDWVAVKAGVKVEAARVVE